MPYIVVSNTFVREVDILQKGKDFSVVLFSKDGGRGEEESAIRVRNSRIYDTREAAEAHARNRAVFAAAAAEPAPAPYQKTQYDYADEYLREQMRRGGRGK